MQKKLKKYLKKTQFSKKVKKKLIRAFKSNKFKKVSKIWIRCKIHKIKVQLRTLVSNLNSQMVKNTKQWKKFRTQHNMEAFVMKK